MSAHLIFKNFCATQIYLHTYLPTTTCIAVSHVCSQSKYVVCGCRYPAGFVYVFALLYWLTNAGANVRLAQYIFAVIYLGTVILVFNIYRRVRKVCCFFCHTSGFGWQCDIVVSVIHRMNEVNARRARLVLGWPSSGGYTILVCNEPTRSTQPCIPEWSLNRVPALLE